MGHQDVGRRWVVVVLQWFSCEGYVDITSNDGLNAIW